MSGSERAALPYPYLVVEGNIGAGKTTLAHALAARYRCELVLESFADNPFLPLFYSDRERYALPLELFFLSERHRQMEPLLRQPSLFGAPVLADYLYLKTWLFARATLAGRERDLFRRLFGQLNAQVPPPRKLVYLHRPTEVLLRQIAGRGRDFERGIDADYLLAVERTYWRYLREERRFPVVALDLGDADFEHSAATLARVVALVEHPHPDGLTIASLTEAPPTRPPAGSPPRRRR